MEESRIEQEQSKNDERINTLLSRLVNSLERREGKLIDRIKKDKKVVRRSKSNYAMHVIAVDDEFPFGTSYNRVNLKKSHPDDYLSQ